MLYEFIHNALPYYLRRFFVRSHRYEPETIGSVKIVTGIVIFLLYYLVLWGTAFLLTDIHIAFIYTITLPLNKSGHPALRRIYPTAVGPYGKA